MKIGIAALLLAFCAGIAMAQTSTSPPNSRAPGATETPATGPATGTSPPRPRVQGNVPATTPGGAAAPETSGQDPAAPRTPTSPDKQAPAPG
jgi:hypothetical protein